MSGASHGDRAYALVDAETGNVASAENPRKWPNLFDHRAAFAEPPVPGADMPPVRVTLADGTVITSDEADADQRISAELDRTVTLTVPAGSIRAAPLPSERDR